MSFTLFGKPIDITESQKNYMKILTDFKKMGNQAMLDFRKEYDEIFGLVFLNSTWSEKFNNTFGSEDYMDNIVKRYVKKTRVYLANYGIYDLSEDAIWNDGILGEDNSMSNLQYRFDSYIVDCISDNLDDDVFISRLKAQFEGQYFANCLYNDIMSLCHYVLNYLNDNEIVTIQFVYKKDSSEAEAIYQNLSSSDVDEMKELEMFISSPEAQYTPDVVISNEKKEELSARLLLLDFSKQQYYEYIFKTFPNARFEIAEIADYVGIDISELIRNDIKTKFNINTATTEEKAKAMLEELMSVMEKYHISESSVKTELENKLVDFDIQARTFDGVLYETRELCAQAKEDDKHLCDLCGDLNALDKEMCNRLLVEIAHTECTVAVKNKYLNLLNDKIITIDKKYLNSLLAELNSADESECNLLKEQINQYDAQDDIKKPYIDCIDKRIYAIWDVEDFERFTTIFTQTSAYDEEQKRINATLILESGRTDTKNVFVTAIRLLNEANILAAAKYAVAKERGFFASLINIGKEDIYNALTISGKIIHPAIQTAIETEKTEKSGGILKGLGFGKKKANDQVPATPSGSIKFCPSCGTKIEGSSNFCANCGNKLN